tara:strand:- start:5074 stop:5847 length:774 start_codon:yes stop_codon:yes gene_type:complete
MYLNKLFNLKGKVAAVIGGGGYLCRTMSIGLSKAGCKLAILDLRHEKAKKVSKEINSNGLEAIALSIDVSKKESHLEALDQIIKKYGKIDILINGAGINGSTPFLEIDSNEWYSIIDSQLTGTFYGCQVFGEHMLKNNSGSIINISSASAGPPLSKAFTYSVSKAGIKNLTQNLAREWGEKGVRVNAIRPGFFPTEWNKKNFITKDREKKILGHTPMNRFGQPEELIGAILWLSSDASSFVTGAEISVDGGYSCMTI